MQSAEELRQLIAMLERSGLAEKRADARALLERSRALLRAQGRARPPPSPRRLVAKLLALLCLLLDGAAVAGFVAGVAGGLAGTLPGPLAGCLLALGPAWGLLRAPALRGWLVEAWLIAAYHAHWGWDWFAEAFSVAAQARLEARLAARELMWQWRQHRRSLPHRAGLPDVEDFLRRAQGAPAAGAFAERLAAQRQQGRAGRLAALRWLALLTAFENLPAGGTPLHDAEPRHYLTRPDPTSPGHAPPDPQSAPAQPFTDTPERVQRRLDLRELIRRKREEVTNAYSWKLKTPAEIAQRELHVNELKADIAALEGELASIEN